MQLFGLINTLLANDRETANRHLSIQRYAIIPLSPNSGLIGWVPNHDTLHDLIKYARVPQRVVCVSCVSCVVCVSCVSCVSCVVCCVLIVVLLRRGYRGPRKIDLNHEHKLMMQVTSKFDELSLIQKVTTPRQPATLTRLAPP